MSTGNQLAKAGRYWRSIRAQVLKSSDRCAICGGRIDMTLSGRDPMGPTVDHITPRVAGGDLMAKTNLQPAHLSCNSRRGARAAKPRQSRSW